ncbi:MAG: UDP-N-acetylmuramate--L-alanine ligase [Oscillospiraceae bacterium]
MDRISELEQYIRSGARCHLIGIGGVSMSPLAKVLCRHGMTITGSDIRDSAVIDDLRKLGIKVFIGHSSENVIGAGFVVRTAAAHDDNPEVAYARAHGIPVFERAEAWGCIMRRYKNALCISGTHGKTTTTSMCTHVLMAAGADPTVMIGGTLPLLHDGHRVGHGDTIVLESCEYYNSFLSFFPTIAVILDIEADHLDFFKDLEDVKASFRKFACLVPEDTGTVVVNCDDKNTMDAIRGIDRKIVTFGFAADADVRAENVVSNYGVSEFDVMYNGGLFTHIELHVPGIHNVKNALAAAASAILLGIPGSAVREGLLNFRGAARRFEYKGSVGGARVYDDYAHHPGELHALIDAARSLEPKRVIVAFQPHTYSRTKALFDDFVTELKRADKVYLAEIYAAREKNTIGISSAHLSEQIPGSVFLPSFGELEEALISEASDGDIILTVGAGNIYEVGEAIVK